MPNFLEDIIASVDRRAAGWAADASIIERDSVKAPPPRSLSIALLRAKPVGVIAECKQRSPSKGVLTEHYDPVAQAQTYETLGASAVSVLTEPDYFLGSMDHLRAVRESIELPVLCKDFVRHPVQIFNARRHGADAVLLIVRILSGQSQLQALKQVIEDLGMQALIEVHSEAELETALAVQPAIVGVNNRDLDTFETTLEFSRKMAAVMPENVLSVSESGIQSAEDIRMLRQLGYRAVLIGEALMRGKRVLEELTP
jgi:indole-3-glycerol phosphate synthase